MGLRSVFASRHVVLPVIHAVDLAQVLRNVEIAVQSGADGVWLINHEVTAQELLEFHAVVKSQFPSLWVGMNMLGYAPTWVDRYPSADGMWSDNAEVDERPESTGGAAYNWSRITGSHWNGLYFGGVAFKGQRTVGPTGWAGAAKNAMPYMDVITTSGPGTGMAADVQKVKKMRTAIGEFPLALASGVTPENVRDYMPYVDAFLVASGISRTFEELDPERTRKLIDIVRSG